MSELVELEKASLSLCLGAQPGQDLLHIPEP